MPLPPATPGFALVPIDLESAAERDLLRIQREICGWNADWVPYWRASAAQGNHRFFWAAVPASTPVPRPARAVGRTGADYPPLSRPPVASDGEVAEPLIAVGHISVDRVDSPDEGMEADTDLASGDGSRLKISSLFVLPEFGGAGLGVAAMLAAETAARKFEPRCRAVTINTRASKYVEAEWAWVWGVTAERPSRPLQGWYEKMGYVKFKDQLRRYETLGDGGRLPWDDTCMIKYLEPLEEAQGEQFGGGGFLQG